jgi:hypothetical protein
LVMGFATGGGKAHHQHKTLANCRVLSKPLSDCATKPPDAGFECANQVNPPPDFM